MNPLVAFTLLSVTAVACSSSDSRATKRSVERVVRGDTTFVTTRANWTPPIDTARVAVTFQGETLEQPSGIVRVGPNLVVADRVQIHVLTEDGEHIATVGNSGEGPGEFGRIMAVGAVADTAVILDVRLMRLAWLDSSGKYIRSMPVPPDLPFVNPRYGSFRLQPYESGFLYQATENVHVDRPTQAAILWRSAERDSVATIRAWDDIDWMDAGRMLAPKELFGPRAHIAIGSEGGYAHGNGVEYCVDLERIDSPTVTRVCRDWSRAPVSAAVKSPDIAEVEKRGLDGMQLEGMRINFETVEIGDHWPAFDQLTIDEVGRLWIRRIGPEQAISHPSLWYYFEDLRPPYFAWDVFDPGGELVRTVVFPSSFGPRLIETGRAFGTMELPSGELTIATATW